MAQVTTKGQTTKDPAKLRILSSDSHIAEPGDLWVNYIDPKYRDRAPRIIDHPVRGDIWQAEGLTLPNIAAFGGAGRTSEEVSTKPSFDKDVRKGGWDPEARLKDNEEGGVESQVLFPTAGFWMYGLADPLLVKACFEAWNNWIRDFCKGHEDRLRGIGFLTLEDIPWAIKELRRCKDMGLVGANIPLQPMDPPYSNTYYDPFWEAAQDVGIPLTSHTGSVRGPNNPARQANAFNERFMPLEQRSWRVAAGTGVANTAVPMLINELILSGVFDRFPRLRIIPTEYEAGWAAFHLDKLDQVLVYQRSKIYVGKLALKPTEYFQRNMALTFINDKTAVLCREIIGVDNIMWSDDFPHVSEGLWKNSGDVHERLFPEAQVSYEDKEKILGGNLLRIYKCFE